MLAFLNLTGIKINNSMAAGKKFAEDIVPVKRTRKEARENYSKLSNYYDLLEGPFEKPYIRAGLEMLNAREGETLLEVGYGTGFGILNLARQVGRSGRVYGIDIAEGMYQTALKKVRKAALAEQVELKCADFLEASFQEHFFDAAFMSFVLELFDTPEIPRVLEKCRRLLKPGGRIGVVAMARKPGLLIRIYEYLHNRFPTHFDCRPIYPTEMLAAAGFRIRQREERSMWGLPVEIVLGIKGDLEHS